MDYNRRQIRISYNMIENGKIGTNKIPWKHILSPDDIRSVIDYVIYTGRFNNE